MERGGGGGKMKNRGSWEDLRKQARQLENEIDLKLVSLSKLGNEIGSFSNSALISKPSEDKVPLLAEEGNSTKEALFQSHVKEIETALHNLTEINEQMTDFAAASDQNSSSSSGSAAIRHTLQRHRDILKDYGQEFAKTKANVSSLLEREDLLSSVHRHIDDYNRRKDPSKARRMDLLLKESEHARNSERMIDDQINIAIDTRETLVNQRVAFKAIQTKLNDLSNRFPMINNLVQKVNLRKKRDSIIIGGIIGLCLLFMIWYMFG